MSELRTWKIMDTEEGAIITPTIPMYCPICSKPLILHDFRVGVTPFYHADVHLKCLQCGNFLTFGIPISKAEYIKLWNSPLRSKILRDELMKLPTQIPTKIIEEKLKTWGYW